VWKNYIYFPPRLKRIGRKTISADETSKITSDRRWPDNGGGGVFDGLLRYFGAKLLYRNDDISRPIRNGCVVYAEFPLFHVLRFRCIQLTKPCEMYLWKNLCEFLSTVQPPTRVPRFGRFGGVSVFSTTRSDFLLFRFWIFFYSRNIFIYFYIFIHLLADFFLFFSQTIMFTKYVQEK